MQKDGVFSGIQLNDDRIIHAELLLVGIGVLPDLGVAADAGLDTGDGIIVDGMMQSSVADIYAIGDVALLDGAMSRIESVDNAQNTAARAAAAICGSSQPHKATPWFWSEQFDARLQSAGIVPQDAAAVQYSAARQAQGGLSVWSYDVRGKLVAIEAVRDPATYMLGKKCLDLGLSPPPSDIGIADFDLKGFRSEWSGVMVYQGTIQRDKLAHIDVRSDTVTQPTRAMRDAMANAEVGDDVYGDDPTVNLLQERAAQLLGKEAGLFVASGTPSNLVALLSHCQRGDELLVGDCFHIHRYEAGGVSVLGGVMMEALATDHRGVIQPSQITDAIKPDDLHCPISRLLCLENTVSGHVHDASHITALATAGKASGLVVHLDGARLMNAAIKLGVPPCNVVEAVDSVSLCLSKGLGAPAGSVLVGSKTFIERARRMRKLVGGGMRQTGILAAAGFYALDHHIERLAEDHANALRLADQLSRISQVTVNPDQVETNMVFMIPPVGSADSLRKYLRERGYDIRWWQSCYSPCDAS